MVAIDWTRVPENHPIKELFRSLTNRALTQVSLRDQGLRLYLTDLLLQFSSVGALYRLRDQEGNRVEYLIDMLSLARDLPRHRRRRHYQYIGDYSLFILGMFPESLARERRLVDRSYYANTGKISHRIASQLERDQSTVVVLRKLVDKFGDCVHLLHWVREYTSDPFYQYMLRQFGAL